MPKLLIIAALAAALLAVVDIGAADAEEPPETTVVRLEPGLNALAEPPETITIRLEPGLNALEWRDPPTPVQELFDAIPQIEAVWQWDAGARRWRSATAALPEQLWSLRLLEPGAQLQVRIGGGEPVVITFRAEPADAPPAPQPGEEDPPAEEEPAEIAEPAGHYIGWVGESTPIKELFNALPQLEAVHSWDVVAQDWRSATPGATERLPQVTPGMGLRLQFSGAPPAAWDRPLTPVRGRVDLRSGRNLVAWLGRDGTPLAEAARGVGSALTAARRVGGGDTLNRGDAVWVTVARDVIWLQPTGALPEIKFPGGASGEVRARVRASLDYTLDFFREMFAIEADFSRFIVYAPRDGDSLIAMIKEDFPELHLQEGWIRGAVAQGTAWVETDGSYTVLPQRMWTEVYDAAYGEENPVWRGQFVTAHEYTHVLQAQLRGLRFSEVRGGLRETASFEPPIWMAEGNAMWVMDAVHVRDGVDSWEGVRAASGADIYAYGSLRESGEAKFYPMGGAATLFLAERFGADAWVDFWRLLGPTRFGPQLRWTQRPHWPDAFAAAFGLTLDEFYAAFEADRAQWGHRVSGRVVIDDALRAVLADQPRFLGFDIQVWGFVAPKPAYGGRIDTTIRTDSEGRFSFNLGDGRYSVAVNIGDCRGRVNDLHVAGAAVTDIDLQVPPCQGSTGGRPDATAVDPDSVATISGRLLDAAGSGLAGVWINAFGGGTHAGAATAADGTFTIGVPEAGAYWLVAYRDGCQVHYTPNGAVASQGRSVPVVVAADDVTWLRFRIPAGMCSTTISGRLLDAAGNGLAGVGINALGISGGASGVTTAADGTFTITVPEAGAYRLGVHLAGCWNYYRRGAVASGWSQATRIDAADDVTGIVFRLPEDPAGLCN